MKKSFHLQRIFAVLSLITITAISTVSGYILLRFLSQHLLERDVSVSAEFIQSVAQINDPEPYFHGSDQDGDRTELEEFFRHITQIPDVLRATVYDKNQSIIWSDDAALIGRRFGDNDELKQALTGVPVFKRDFAGEKEKIEHRFLPPQVTDFVESYVPVWSNDRREVIGVVELYKSPSALFAALAHGRWLVLAVSVIGGVVLYLILFWIVRRASKTIEQQGRELQAQVRQLSELLAQNQELHQRVKRASSRAVELNEQFLRRVGAELHDGPAQALGFALLRLDAINEGDGNQDCISGIKTHTRGEFETIRGALRDALQEIRSLSAGLAIPELVDLTLPHALQRAVRTHQQRTGTKVHLCLDVLPDYVPQPLKICAYRFIQEGLNNAYRHGEGRQQRVEASYENAALQISVSDSGPGFELATVHTGANERLGLIGLRERIESLGGYFFVDSAPGRGAQVTASLPVEERGRW